MVKKNELFNIGIGTWKINPDSINDDLEGLLHSYNKGQNYLLMLILSHQ